MMPTAFPKKKIGLHVREFSGFDKLYKQLLGHEVVFG